MDTAVPSVGATNESVSLPLPLLLRIADVLERVAAHLDRKHSPSENRTDPEYLSINQAAALASLSPSKVRREVKSGRLPASDVGTPDHPHYRIAKADLQAWLEKNRGGASAPPQPQRVRKKIQSRHFGDM